MTLFARGARDAGRGVLAVDPRAGQLLVLRRVQRAALVVALPADDLVGLAVLVAALLPALGPAGVGLLDLALFLVPKERLAGPVALHAHRHGRERCGAQVRRAEGLAVAAAAGFEEVLPQRRRRVALADAAADEARLGLLLLLAAGGPVGQLLRDDVGAVFDLLTLPLRLALRKPHRRQVAADDFLNRVVI